MTKQFTRQEVEAVVERILQNNYKRVIYIYQAT